MIQLNMYCELVMKKLLIVIGTICIFSSCYLCDENVEVQFINESDLTITSIQFSTDEITYSDNILKSNLLPDQESSYSLPPGMYIFQFTTTSTYVFHSQLKDLLGYDFYRIHIKDKVIE